MGPLTRRGWLVLGAALGLYAVSAGFGIREGFVLAVGLALAALLALLHVRFGARPMELARSVPGEHREGDPLAVRVELQPRSGLVPMRAVVVDDVAQAGEREALCRRRGRRLVGSYRVGAMPRGRYVLEGARLRVIDPFGLARAEQTLDGRDVLLVYPRLTHIPRPVALGLGGVGGSRRFLVSRVSGADLHGVRDWQPGESLRQVHWKTTARRGRLMVKELEDSPREAAIVVLDAGSAGEAGRPPDSSFEQCVRVAGSLAHALVLAGERTALVTLGATRQRRVATSPADWPALLELLATVRPDGTRPLAAALGDGSDLDALRLLIVTADFGPAAAGRIAALAGARRDAAVAWIDRSGWDDGSAEAGEAATAGCQRAGVPVLRVRRGDDLAAALSAPLRAEEAARALA